MRNSFDFTPYRRSTVGFDRLFDLLETGARVDADAYPPFDIVRDGEDSYRITLAVASFRPDEIDLVAQQNQLTVTGKRADDDDKRQYLHRGIAPGFRTAFPARGLHRSGTCPLARCENGLLSVELRRVVPETMKPRKIEIFDAPANDRLSAPREADRDAA